MYFPSRYSAGRLFAPRNGGVRRYPFGMESNTYQRAPPHQGTPKWRQSKMQAQAKPTKWSRKSRRNNLGANQSEAATTTSLIRKPCIRMTGLRDRESWLEISATGAARVMLALVSKTVQKHYKSTILGGASGRITNPETSQGRQGVSTRAGGGWCGYKETGEGKYNGNRRS